MMPIDQVRSILPALELRREQPPMQAKWIKLDMRYAQETTLVIHTLQANSGSFLVLYFCTFTTLE